LLDETGKVLRVWSLKTKTGSWEEAYDRITKEVTEQRFDRVVVESVVWYGRRKGLYDLNKLVGALWSYFKARVGDDRLALVVPGSKPKLNKALKHKAKNDHEADAISLAMFGIKRKWGKKREERIPARTRFRTRLPSN